MSDTMQPQDVTPIYHRAASMFNLDPLLPMAVAQVESGGEPDPDRAVSSAGALGRMQIMPANLQAMNVRDPTDPEQNIYAGTSLLDQALTASKGDVATALRIYQGGPDQSKWGPQNAAYPAKVAAAYTRLAAQRAQQPPQQATSAQPMAPTQSDPAPSTPPPAAQPMVQPVAQPTSQAAAQPAAAMNTPPSATTPQPAQPAAPDSLDDFLTGRSANVAPPSSPASQQGAQAHVADPIDAFLSGSPAPTAAPAGSTPQPAVWPLDSTNAPSVPTPFPDSGGILPDGSATKDPAVWARWLSQAQASAPSAASALGLKIPPSIERFPFLMGWILRPFVSRASFHGSLDAILKGFFLKLGLDAFPHDGPPEENERGSIPERSVTDLPK